MPQAKYFLKKFKKASQNIRVNFLVSEVFGKMVFSMCIYDNLSAIYGLLTH
jgi:hypothetical protein